MMKTTTEKHQISKALQEVWDWKQKSYEDTKGMKFEQLKTHLRNSMEEIATMMNATIVLNPDGTCQLVTRINTQK